MFTVFVQNGAVVGWATGAQDGVSVTGPEGSIAYVIPDTTHVLVGYLCTIVGDTITFTPPAAVPPVVSIAVFKALFTFQEEIDIEASTDAMVKSLPNRISDPRVTTVDLNLNSTRQWLARLVTVGILTADRVPQILAGIQQ